MAKFLKVCRSQNQARRNYNHMSRWYDISQGLFERFFTGLGIQLLEVKPSDHILEIGCGTGMAAIKIAKDLENGKFTGIDISNGMISIANRKANNQLNDYQRKRVCFEVKNALTIEFSSYDKIFMSFVLELFTAAEMKHILEGCFQSLQKRGGKVVIVSLYREYHPRKVVKIYEYFHHLYPVEIDCRPIPLDSILKIVGFRLGRHRIVSMWGLPVQIIEAFT